MKFASILLAVALAAGATPAAAFCMYRGELYAKTTLEQEFADSRYVVRAKVLSGVNVFSDEEDSWVMYELAALEVFKGAPPTTFRLFSYRNSGGFYLDGEHGPDVGGEYLLFLQRMEPGRTLPDQAKGALDVNYGCGWSRLWKEIRPEARRRLSILQARARLRDARGLDQRKAPPGSLRTGLLRDASPERRDQ